ncbi:MAG: BamA/TamA family outer membrane protein [Bacteroidota bacterium]|nr:BamA/TamA family outer membrane protein [Bacteroidota bacterium]
MKNIIILSLLLLTIFINFNKLLAKSDTTSIDNLKLNQSSNIIVDEIKILGNKKTKENIILRELTLKEGIIISKDKFISTIEEDKRKVINTDLFYEVEFKIEIIKENHVIIIINVLESIYWVPIIIFELSDRNFNDWWENFNHDFNRINYGLGFAHYNISGRADEFEVLLRLGFIKQFQTSYYIPYITKKQKGGLYIGFDYIDYNHLEYNSINYIPIFYKSKNSLLKELSTSIEYSHRESFYNYHYFELEYNNIILNDTLSLINDNYFYGNRIKNSFNINYEFDRDFRDIKNYPLNGFRLNIQIEKTGIGIFNDINKWKASIYYSKYFEFKKQFYYSFTLLSYFSSKNQPYYLYENTDQLRGYEKYLIHGHSNLIYKNTLKKRIVSKNFNIEKMKFRKFKNIPINIYLKMFFDSGYVWKYSNKNQNINLNNKYLHSFGIGLDFVTIKNLYITTELSRNSNKELNFSINLGANF